MLGGPGSVQNFMVISLAEAQRPELLRKKVLLWGFQHVVQINPWNHLHLLPLGGER